MAAAELLKIKTMDKLADANAQCMMPLKFEIYTHKETDIRKINNIPEEPNEMRYDKRDQGKGRIREGVESGRQPQSYKGRVR